MLNCIVQACGVACASCCRGLGQVVAVAAVAQSIIIHTDVRIVNLVVEVVMPFRVFVSCCCLRR